MPQRVPPPPTLANVDPALNRWLIELQSILNSSGVIEPANVQGLTTLEAEVAANSASIDALNGITSNQGESIALVQSQVSTNSLAIATINGQITTLSARAQVLNGAGAPAGGTGNVNDWYADTTNKHVYVKTGATTWLLIV